MQSLDLSPRREAAGGQIERATGGHEMSVAIRQRSPRQARVVARIRIAGPSERPLPALRTEWPHDALAAGR